MHRFGGMVLMPTSRWLLVASSYVPTLLATRAALGQACIIDSAAARLPVPVVVYLARKDNAALSTEAALEQHRYLEALAAFFVRPPHLDLPLLPVLDAHSLGKSPDSIHFQIDGPLLLPLTSSGRLARAAPQASSASAELNRAVEMAVRRMDSAGGMPIPHWRASQTTAFLVAWIDAAAEAPPDGIPLLRTGLPVLRADTDTKPIDIPKPIYPPHYQMNREGASLDLRYIVLETGRVDPASIEVLSVLYDGSGNLADATRAFVEASTRVLRMGRFKPATIGDCRVRTLIRQRIVYQAR